MEQNGHQFLISPEMNDLQLHFGRRIIIVGFAG